jgi:uncharacterized protein
MPTATTPSRIREDFAYMLPMGIFLAFTFVGGQWPSLFPASYIAKTFIVAIALVLLWRNFTKIQWNHWWLGIFVGIIGVVQWVGMEKLLLHHVGEYHFMTAPDPFDPFKQFSPPAGAWSFILIRMACATLVVPVMEELFWRDYLWRTILAPRDFLLARVGEWNWKAFLLVAIAFGATVHFEWLTAIVWGLLIGGLLIYTRSLGACIIAHGVTNFLLGIYVLIYHDWRFW